jgi:hypothetical protein
MRASELPLRVARPAGTARRRGWLEFHGDGIFVCGDAGSGYGCSIHIGSGREGIARSSARSPASSEAARRECEPPSAQLQSRSSSQLDNRCLVGFKAVARLRVKPAVPGFTTQAYFLTGCSIECYRLDSDAKPCRTACSWRVRP